MTENPTESPLVPRLSAARLLVFGGISLMLAGMLLGEVFAIFISHVASAQIRHEWVATVIPAIARRDLYAVRAGYDRIEDLLERRGRIMDAHSHLTAYGFVALALALLQPVSKYPERIRWVLAVCIVAGGLLQSLSVFVSYWMSPQTRNWVLLASASGGLLVLVGVLGNCMALPGAPLRSEFVSETKRRLSSSSSQLLLKAGALLILTGMAFGFYYAWVFVTQHEPRQAVLFSGALASAVSGDTSGATGSILAYRGLQSRVAIVSAAHSHIIEMGIMAVLLAFVQDFVFLSVRWKHRWAVLFCAGGAIMPLCTYCASIYGLVFAGLADTFGMMSVAALFAMLSGLIRHAGAMEDRVAA